MENDYLKKDKFADLFYSVVNEYSGRINSLRNYVLAYWIPSYENVNDSYMTMSL